MYPARPIFIKHTERYCHIWPAVIAAGASIAGGMMANRSQQGQSAAQMRFQERMSSTAHQREVKDLRAAGLNPILSANKGASSPGGAQANIRNIMEGATSSAVAAARTQQELKNLSAQEELTKTQNRKTGHEADINAIEALIKAKILEMGTNSGTNAFKNFLNKAEKSLGEIFQGTGETQSQFESRIHKKKTKKGTKKIPTITIRPKK